MNGILDFVTGGGQYADPNAIHKTYGVPQSDVRQALLNSLMSAGASLLAAGQPIAPAQRAQLIGQAGAAFGNIGTDTYNAAQRRLMQQQFEARRSEIEGTKQIAEQIADPIGFRARYGFDPSGMTPQAVREILSQRQRENVLDPEAAERRRLALQTQQAQLTAKQQALVRPQILEAGGALYRIDPQTGQPTALTSPRPQGGLEGEAQAILLAGANNEALRATPQYALAYNRVFGPRSEVRNGELVTFVPPIPPGILPPTGGAPQAPAAPAGAQPPSVMQLPGGGTATQTSLGPRRLTPAEVALKETTEDAIAATQGARQSLEEALRLSGQAYAGPYAEQRATISSLFPGDNRTATATKQFGALMTKQALDQLRTIFGGNPTEGERKILTEMQASPNMDRAVRDALIRDAIKAAESRLPRLQQRLGEIQAGTYGVAAPPSAQPTAPQPQQPTAPQNDAMINRLIRSADLPTLRQIDQNSLTDEQKKLFLERLNQLGGR
jgi:hypothetical protein